MVAVPRAWAGETVTILATGPSLTQADVDLVRGKTRVIAVNDSYRLAPWADVLYACDPSWWLHHPQAYALPLDKWSIQHDLWPEYTPRFPAIQRLKNTGFTGLELDPTALRNGGNSGYQAVNLAVHFGAATILLLGFDMGAPKGAKTHFFGVHQWNPTRSPYHTFLEYFDTLAHPLQEAGVRVINCSPVSELRCFPSMPISEALAAFPSQAVAA